MVLQSSRNKRNLYFGYSIIIQQKHVSNCPKHSICWSNWMYILLWIPEFVYWRKIVGSKAGLVLVWYKYYMHGIMIMISISKNDHKKLTSTPKSKSQLTPRLPNQSKCTKNFAAHSLPYTYIKCEKRTIIYIFLLSYYNTIL